MPFAKLYGSGDDQVLVVLNLENDAGNPELRYYFQPKGIGLCSATRYWPNHVAGALGARLAFDCVCEQSARAFIAPSLEEVANLARWKK